MADKTENNIMYCLLYSDEGTERMNGKTGARKIFLILQVSGIVAFYIIRYNLNLLSCVVRLSAYNCLDFLYLSVVQLSQKHSYYNWH